MALYPARGGDAMRSIRIYNNDGSEAGACGNGMRCVAALVSAETGKAELTFETPAGLDPLLARPTTACSRSIWAGRACAGTRFRWREEFADTRAIELEIGPRGAPILHSPSVVSMGNPHAIFWVDDPAAYDLAKIGPLLEHHPMFPERANITLAATPTRDHIVIRTWERGAGLTKACGSAACAAAVAAARLEPHRPQGDGHAARRRSRHRMARGRRSCADDRPGRIRAQGPLRCGACSPARGAA